MATIKTPIRIGDDTPLRNFQADEAVGPDHGGTGIVTSDLVGQAGKVLTVNGTEDGYTLATGGGGGGGGVSTVTGDSVDNTDPANPVVNALPLSVSGTKEVVLDDGNGVSFAISSDFEPNEGFSGAGFWGGGYNSGSWAGIYYDEFNSNYSFEINMYDPVSFAGSFLRFKTNGVEFGSSGGGFSFAGYPINLNNRLEIANATDDPQLVKVTGGVFVLPLFSTTERDAFNDPPSAGWTIYCTDATANDGSTGVAQTYNGSTWKNHW